MLQLLNNPAGNDVGRETGISSGMLMSSKTSFKSPKSGRLILVGRLSPLAVMDEPPWLVAAATVEDEDEGRPPATLR